MPDDMVFKNLVAVGNYLKGKGYKIGKSAVYNHAAEGKLKPNESGIYVQKAVDKYAQVWLKRVDGSRPREEDEALTRELREAELSKTKAQSRTWHERAIMAEKQRKIAEKAEAHDWFHRYDFERNLAAKATLFKSDLENFARGYAGQIVNLVNGDPVRTPYLLQFLRENFETFLGRYCIEAPFPIPHSEAFIRFCKESGFHLEAAAAEKINPSDPGILEENKDPEDPEDEDLDELDLDVQTELVRDPLVTDKVITPEGTQEN